MKKTCIVTVLVLLTTLTGWSQDITMKLHYNEANSNITLTDNNGKTANTFSVDLNKSGLTILASRFPDNYKLILNREADNGSKIPDTVINLPNGKQVSIVITKGGHLIQGTDTIQLGSEIKFSTPDKKKSWTIKTGLKVLEKVQEIVSFDKSGGVKTGETEIIMSEYPFYDALALSDPNVKLSKKINILKFYTKLQPSARCEDMKDSLQKNGNKFLLKYVDSICAADTSSGTKMGTGKTFSIPGISAIGGLDVTNFADGLAKFLVDRTKQELSNYFFERFKKDLDSIPQLKILFPFTFNALQAIDKEIYNYTAYLNLLRDCFQKDLTLLLPDLQKLVDDDCMNKIFEKNKVLRIILSDGLYIINDLQSGMHPGDVFHDYITSRPKARLDSIYTYLYPSFQTLDLISQSLRSKQSDQYWIGKDSIPLLFKPGTQTFTIYLGLLYQQAMQKNIYFDKGVTLASAMQMYEPKYKDYIQGVIQKGKQVDYYFNLIKSKQKKNDGKPTYQDYYGMYDASLNLLEHLKNGVSLVGIKVPDKTNNNLNLFFVTARSAGNIYVDIYEQQYSSAIVEASALFDALFSKSKNTEVDNAQFGRFDEFAALIMKYGGLGSAIVNAENSDEVQKAIESYALPAGSSSVKRESQFNVSVNAYVGVFAGHEIIKGVGTDLFLNNYGVSAPVGISVSWGGVKCNPKWGGNSLGFFVSVIDIGALASFRFGDDSTSTVPLIQLQDIIAPGLFFSWGIAGTPFSLSAGAQIGPLLRNVAASVNTFTDNYYWRYGITFTVDIPILNLYNRGK